MTILVSETEMVQRYVDGLNRASSRASEFVTEVSPQKKAELFVDFIDNIKVAAGSSHQLAHQQMNPKWLDVRDILEGVISVSQSITVFSGADNALWNSIKNSLDMMVIQGKKMATSKAMTRQDVLTNLDHRLKVLNETANVT